MSCKPPFKEKLDTPVAGHAVNSQPSAVRPFRYCPSCTELPRPCHTLHRAADIHWGYIGLTILAQLRTTLMDQSNSRAPHAVSLRLSLGPYLGLTLSARLCSIPHFHRCCSQGHPLISRVHAKLHLRIYFLGNSTCNTMLRILNFITTVMGSHWIVYTGQCHDLCCILEDHLAPL